MSVESIGKVWAQIYDPIGGAVNETDPCTLEMRG